MKSIKSIKSIKIKPINEINNVTIYAFFNVGPQLISFTTTLNVFDYRGPFCLR